MKEARQWHPLLASLKQLHWECVNVEVRFQNPAYTDYQVTGEVMFSAGSVRVSADWVATLIPEGVKICEKRFCLDLDVAIECSNLEMDSSTGFGMNWPNQDEQLDWLTEFFDRETITDALWPHLPTPDLTCRPE